MRYSLVAFLVHVLSLAASLSAANPTGPGVRLYNDTSDTLDFAGAASQGQTPPNQLDPGEMLAPGQTALLIPGTGDITGNYTFKIQRLGFSPNQADVTVTRLMAFGSWQYANDPLFASEVPENFIMPASEIISPGSRQWYARVDQQWTALNGPEALADLTFFAFTTDLSGAVPANQFAPGQPGRFMELSQPNPLGPIDAIPPEFGTLEFRVLLGYSSGNVYDTIISVDPLDFHLNYLFASWGMVPSEVTTATWSLVVSGGGSDESNDSGSCSNSAHDGRTGLWLAASIALMCIGRRKVTAERSQ